MAYNDILYYLLYSCTDPIFGRNLISEILAKMLSANQIARFSNQLYMSLEQNDEKAGFFACWYRFMKNKSLLKIIGVGVVKNECVHSSCVTLRLVVSQEGINGMN